MNQEKNIENIEELWKLVSYECKQSSFKDRGLPKSAGSVRALRQLCGNCACHFSRFTPHQNLSSILRLSTSKNTVSTDYNIGLAILTNYSAFFHESHCLTALENIVTSALTAPKSDHRHSFLKLVWNHPSFQRFSIIVVEDFILQETQLLEEDLLDLFISSLLKTEQDNILKSQQCNNLIHWCCKSAKLFALVTSALNSLLTKICERTSSYSKCVNVVHQFVDSVKFKCSESKTDFVLLYPREYHTLVMFLNINPKFFSNNLGNNFSVTLETVVDLVNKNMVLRPIQTFSILTHFPEWAPYVSPLK